MEADVEDVMLWEGHLGSREAAMEDGFEMFGCASRVHLASGCAGQPRNLVAHQFSRTTSDRSTVEGPC